MYRIALEMGRFLVPLTVTNTVSTVVCTNIKIVVSGKIVMYGVNCDMLLKLMGKTI